VAKKERMTINSAFGEEEFISAYGIDAAPDVFWHAKQCVMAIISNHKRAFLSAIEQEELMQRMGIAQYTLAYFVPELKTFQFPRHASPEWREAEQSFAHRYLGLMTRPQTPKSSPGM